jgi:hypothetical protein
MTDPKAVAAAYEKAYGPDWHQQFRRTPKASPPPREAAVLARLGAVLAGEHSAGSYAELWLARQVEAMANGRPFVPLPDGPDGEPYDARLARVREKQWQAALRTVKSMRAELVRRGCTDKDILGEPVLTIPGPSAVETWSVRSATEAEADWLRRTHPDLKPGQGVPLPDEFNLTAEMWVRNPDGGVTRVIDPDAADTPSVVEDDRVDPITR